jgi:exosortase D (VPLPA-CTERM-specific)
VTQVMRATEIRRAYGGNVSGWLLLLLSFGGLGVYFWQGITSLYDAWLKPEYSHGPLIPVIAAYLVLREMRDGGFGAVKGSRSPGLVVVLLGLIVGFLGNLTQIPYFITYGLILTVGGIILMFAGSQRGIKFWVPWLFLIFMLPLPTALYWQLSTQLQLLSSKLGVFLISSLGIPVLLDGNVIDLGVYQLQVAEACSGLRYLFPLSSFSFLFAALYRGPFWHRLILFLSSLPITVAMNSFRIGVIGVLVNSFGIAQAEGFLHLFEGWVIFVACIAILFLEANILQRLRAKPLPVLNVLDLDLSGMLAPLRSLTRVSADSWLAALAIVSIVSSVLWVASPKSKLVVPDHRPLATFPLELGGWQGTEVRNDADTEKTLGADEYLSVNYADPLTGQSFNFFTAFYISTTDGSGIHNPEVCIPGSGWEVAKWDQYMVPNADAKQPGLAVNRAIIRKGSERKVVYYWYEMRGKRFTNEYRAKIQTIIDSATKSRADGALVRFMTPLTSTEKESDADMRLAKVIPIVLTLLPEFVPP